METASAVKAAKKMLRQSVLAARRAMSPASRQAASRQMLTELYTQPDFVSARTVFLYASMADEVQLYPLMEQCLLLEKTVCLPLITGPGTMDAVRLSAMDALVPGEFGIKTIDPVQCELVPPSVIDLIVVPGVAFDDQGRRLGLGAGYYDRFMAERAPQARRIALAFDCQLADCVPIEPHDQIVDLVITENRCLKVSDGMWK